MVKLGTVHYKSTNGGIKMSVWENGKNEVIFYFQFN